MIRNDSAEKERVDARNALEEYVYDMREKIGEDGSLAPYVIDSDRQSISNQLNDLENWLYEEGEDCEKDVYRSQLNKLHSVTDPIKARCSEYENQPAEFNQLGHTIQMARKAVLEYKSGTPKYDHLTETEMLNISEAADKAQKWHDDQIVKFQRAVKTNDPPVKSSDIRHETQTLSTCLNSVLNRPKPKPPTPPADPAATNNDNSKQAPQDQQKHQQQNHQKNNDQQSTEPSINDSEMDVE